MSACTLDCSTSHGCDSHAWPCCTCVPISAYAASCSTGASHAHVHHCQHLNQCIHTVLCQQPTPPTTPTPPLPLCAALQMISKICCNMVLPAMPHAAATASCTCYCAPAPLATAPAALTATPPHPPSVPLGGLFACLLQHRQWQWRPLQEHHSTAYSAHLSNPQRLQHSGKRMHSPASTHRLKHAGRPQAELCNYRLHNAHGRHSKLLLLHREQSEPGARQLLAG
jgi:hypothetical protein